MKIESVSVSRDGFSRPELEEEKEQETKRRRQEEAEKKAAEEKGKKSWPKKQNKKKFRYETRIERQLTDRKQKAKSKSRG